MSSQPAGPRQHQEPALQKQGYSDSAMHRLGATECYCSRSRKAPASNDGHLLLCPKTLTNAPEVCSFEVSSTHSFRGVSICTGATCRAESRVSSNWADITTKPLMALPRVTKVLCTLRQRVAIQSRFDLPRGLSNPAHVVPIIVSVAINDDTAQNTISS